MHLFAKFAQALATALCGHAYSIGQILHTNLAPIAQDLSALDRAAQLTHITRPVVMQHHLQCLFAYG